MPFWGLLANPGFKDQRLKAVYFFAGNAKIGEDPFWSRPFYKEETPRNDQYYTVFPEDGRHLRWSEDRANQDFALTEILNTGANVVVMSSWGPRGSHRWAWSAPMQTAPDAHDELFAAAVGRPLLIMPAIESAGGTPDGTSPAFVFSEDFPGTPDNPAPALVQQLIELVDRYLLNPKDSHWPAHWAQMYDSSGSPRFAVYLLHVASRHLNDDAHAEFAAGFDAVAKRVFDSTGVRIGFTLDLLPTSHSFQIGDGRGWVEWFKPRENIRINPGSPITQTWANRDHLDLFVINARGIVSSTWWDQAEPAGYRPDGWFTIRSETLFHPGALVTAIRRTADHLDLFATDNDGIVRSIWWDRDAGGYRPDGWFEIHSEMRCTPGAPVAASWANEDHLDLFVTDRFGVVHSTYWDDNDGGYRAEGWFPIRSDTIFKPGAQVSVTRSGEDHLDLFAADRDGVVRSIWWDVDGGYRAEGWFAIHSEKKTAPGAQVTALWADDKHLDLFMTGDDGVVRSIYWDAREPLGYRSGGWFEIHSDVKSKPGAPVEALWSHDQTKLHLFIADIGGRIMEAVWPNEFDSTNPWQNWVPIWPPLGPPFTPRAQYKTIAGGAVTASHPRGVHLDAFMVDVTGSPFTSWQDFLRDNYVPDPDGLGPELKKQASMLAVQGFIPEIWMGGKTNRARIIKKANYWWNWAIQGVPVLMDISPGYDAHKIFPDSSFYGYSDEWRGWFVALWRPWFSGVVYNTWNGYTEGYAGMRQQISGDRDFAWLQRMFGLF